MNVDRDKALRDILAFYVEAGVDALLREAPVDRFATPLPEQKPPAPLPSTDAPGPLLPEPQYRSRGNASGGSNAQRGRPPAARQSAAPPLAASAPLAPDAAVMAAREAARHAASLDALRAILAGFDGCALKATATQLVFADGNPQAPVMFVGEAPGRDEDLAGLPFVGRSGQLLDRMLAVIGLDRTSAYIANIIPWRPPGNRTPTPQESAICLPFIKRQIELADPHVLVCLGGPSAQALLGVKEGILRTRGRWFSYETGRREIRAIATLHPAYLLRQPLQKRLAWRDFLLIRKALNS
jgi:uracil-DNA glycosylase family 4